MNDLNYIKPHGTRILHVARGKLAVGQGTRAACGKFVGKFALVEGLDKTKLCEKCEETLLKESR